MPALKAVPESLDKKIGGKQVKQKMASTSDIFFVLTNPAHVNQLFFVFLGQEEATDDMQADFEREATLLAEFDHPNIGTITVDLLCR
jgi:hypothetical protein